MLSCVFPPWLLNPTSAELEQHPQLHWKEVANSSFTGWPFDVKPFFQMQCITSCNYQQHNTFRTGGSVMFGSQEQGSIFIVASMEDSAGQTVMWDPCSHIGSQWFMLGGTLKAPLSPNSPAWAGNLLDHIVQSCIQLGLGEAFMASLGKLFSASPPLQ